MRYSDLVQPLRLDEEVHGNIAIVYHRTPAPSAVQSIEDAGFKAGDGKSYGVGIYTTFDFPSQLNARMLRLYGRYIVRCKLDLHGFIIFDSTVARTVYGRQASLADQFAMHRLPFDPAAWKTTDCDYSSKLAGKLALVRGIEKRISGMLFSGASDGRVAVCYEPRRLIPISYMQAGEDFLDSYDAGEAELMDFNALWTPLDAKGAMKRRYSPAEPHAPLLAVLGDRRTLPKVFLRAFNHVLQGADRCPDDLVKAALVGAFFDHQDDPGFRAGITTASRTQMARLRARNFPEGFPWEDLDEDHVPPDAGGHTI